jgi:hypothetical protein
VTLFGRLRPQSEAVICTDLDLRYALGRYAKSRGADKVECSLPTWGCLCWTASG